MNILPKLTKRHYCAQQGWAHCCVCDGRMHESGCTTKKRRKIDCCPERHKMLHEQGQVKGISDCSFFMWHQDFPFGWHPNDQNKPEVAE